MFAKTAANFRCTVWTFLGESRGGLHQPELAKATARVSRAIIVHERSNPAETDFKVKAQLNINSDVSYR
jgi:hypothetical protein